MTTATEPVPAAAEPKPKPAEAQPKPRRIPPSHMPGRCHARRQGVQKVQCVALNRVNGKQCRRFAAGPGKGRLCRTHKDLALSQNLSESDLLAPPTTGLGAPTDGLPVAGPEPTAGGLARAGISTKVKRQAERAEAAINTRRAINSSVVIKNARSRGQTTAAHSGTNRGLSPTNYVLNEQAKSALAKLGEPFDPSKHFDPKVVLLDMVNSAWQQQRIWVALLSTVPDSDWEQVGMTPIPGNAASSKGARIEAIQKYLAEATKVAARTSASAISAGIEERLVRLAEEQQILIADTVRAALIAGVAALIRSFHLNQEAESRAIEAAVGAAANHLRALAAGGTEVVEGVARVVNKPTQAEIKAERNAARRRAYHSPSEETNGA